MRVLFAGAGGARRGSTLQPGSARTGLAVLEPERGIDQKELGVRGRSSIN